GARALRAQHRLRLRAPVGPLRGRGRESARGARRRAGHRCVAQGGAIRPHLRRVQHPAGHLRGRARVPPRHRAGVGRHHHARSEAVVRVLGSDGPQADGDHPQGVRRRLRRDGVQAHPRRRQPGLADRGDRGDGPRRGRQHRLPQRAGEGEGRGEDEAGAGPEVPRHLRESLQGRRARVRGRGHPARGHAAAALPRARHAPPQAAGRAAPQARKHPALKRELTLLDAVGIGVNGIVGSGIYLLVAPLARAGGGSSVAGVLGCGGVCVLIALCFAELSSMYDRSGGPYVYARDAFGENVGFAVGWLGMSTGVLGLAAVAVGFAGALSRFWPAAATPRAPIAVALIAALGFINWLGVRQGGRTSTALSVLKIVPLLAVALAGLRFAPHAPLSFELRGAASAAFLAIFMMSGFEYAAVPAGEVRDARRTVPLAIVGSISGAALLYALLQLAALATLPDLAAR